MSEEAYEQKKARREAVVNDPARAARVRAYLAELISVGKRHGFALSHQDTQGAFEVVGRQGGEAVYEDDWLKNAQDMGDE